MGKTATGMRGRRMRQKQWLTRKQSTIFAYNMATPKCNLLLPYSSCGENVLLYIRVALEFAKARNEFMLAALRLQRVEEGSPVSLNGPSFVYRLVF